MINFYIGRIAPSLLKELKNKGPHPTTVYKLNNPGLHANCTNPTILHCKPRKTCDSQRRITHRCFRCSKQLMAICNRFNIVYADF